MSRLGMKTAVARAIVDPDWRKQFVGPGSDMKKAVKSAGYDVTDTEIDMLKCNSPDSFDPRFVTIDTMEEFWEISEQRINAALSQANMGQAPGPGTL